MRSIRTAFVVLAVLAMASCNIFIGLFSSSPSVTMTAEHLRFTSGHVVVIAADASDPNNLPLTFQWFEDGVSLGISSPQIEYSRFVESSRQVTISLTVTNTNNDKTTKTLALTIDPPANPVTLTVYNNYNNHVVWYLYLSNDPSYWGLDQMREAVAPIITSIPYLGSFELKGIPAGYWDLKAKAGDYIPSTGEILILKTWDTTTPTPAPLDLTISRSYVLN
jgi:hypothetical protein